MSFSVQKGRSRFQRLCLRFVKIGAVVASIQPMAWSLWLRSLRWQLWGSHTQSGNILERYLTLLRLYDFTLNSVDSSTYSVFSRTNTLGRHTTWNIIWRKWESSNKTFSFEGSIYEDSFGGNDIIAEECSFSITDVLHADLDKMWLTKQLNVNRAASFPFCSGECFHSFSRGH